MYFRCLCVIAFAALAVAESNAATILSDNFAASTLNSLSPAAPTVTSAAYHLFSSKSYSPAPAIAGNDLKFGIGSTTSGHIEVQSLFSTTPIALTNIGEYIELSVTFTNTVGLFTTNCHVGFGLYNSGGVAPIAGGMQSTAVSGTTGITGGAQGWQGYVARFAYNGGTHRIATRPAQTITTGNNQDLVTEGSSSQSYPGGVNLSTTASTFSQSAGSQLTKTLRYTLSAAGTLLIESKLYSGGDTNGSLLLTQSTTASGANFLTNSFDALGIGWRFTSSNVGGSVMDIRSITVTTSVPIIGGGPTNTVAGIYFQQQPTNAIAGATLTPAITVVATNSAGLPVTNTSITLSLLSGSAPLNGTLTQATDAGGIATFNNLNLTTDGAKQLRATSGSFTADSAAFTITNVIVAFPGAMGSGANASGGRGGDVYYVTTLANTGAGSLRNGITGAPAGGRTILFKVSGNIVLTSTLTIVHSNITIAGQTAPGDGICLQNYSFNIAANNIILRHVRTRLGTNALQEADAMWINGGTNLIVDHVSASWSVDETLSTSRAVANLTVQNCFITESLRNSIHVKGQHGYGGIISCENDATFTYHHNLYAHHTSRNPRVGSDNSNATMRVDFRNNAVYNWGFFVGYGGPSDENVELNYVSNYFLAGPFSTKVHAYDGDALTTTIYQSGNVIDNNKNGVLDGVSSGWSMFTGVFTQTNSPFNAPAMTTDTPTVALQKILALSGAMPWRRDAYDQRIARSVRSQNGQHIDFVAVNTFAGDYITNNISGTNYTGVNPWPTLASETAPTDTDSDGMPDWWELAVGLNANNTTDRNNTDASGYTELEVYLNWLADAHALCDRNGTVDVNLRTATGGATNLTYSVANGTNGTVTLLGDGYTARFTAAANTNGVANFTFTATGNGTLFGPMNYGILISTTNAPTSNTPPTLAAITNRTIIAGTTINFTNTASDTNIPAQTLTFSLQGGQAGSSLNSVNGIFTWRPTIAQSPSTNPMSVIVTDNGTPAMSATQSFTVFVTRPVTPTLQSASVTGGTFNMLVTGDTGPDYTIQASTNLANWSSLFTTNSPALPFNWSDPSAASFNQRYFRVLLGP